MTSDGSIIGLQDSTKPLDYTHILLSNKVDNNATMTLKIKQLTSYDEASIFIRFYNSFPKSLNDKEKLQRIQSLVDKSNLIQTASQFHAGYVLFEFTQEPKTYIFNSAGQLLILNEGEVSRAVELVSTVFSPVLAQIPSVGFSKTLLLQCHPLCFVPLLSMQPVPTKPIVSASGFDLPSDEEFTERVTIKCLVYLTSIGANISGNSLTRPQIYNYFEVNENDEFIDISVQESPKLRKVTIPSTSQDGPVTTAIKDLLKEFGGTANLNEFMDKLSRMFPSYSSETLSAIISEITWIEVTNDSIKVWH